MCGKDVTEDGWHGTRPDAKRPDGLTLVPWAVGKQLLLDVTVVDSLAPCRIEAVSVCNPGKAAAEAEERKNDKFKDLVDDCYLFQPLVFEMIDKITFDEIFHL